MARMECFRHKVEGVHPPRNSKLASRKKGAAWYTMFEWLGMRNGHNCYGLGIGVLQSEVKCLYVLPYREEAEDLLCSEGMLSQDGYIRMGD